MQPYPPIPIDSIVHGDAATVLSQFPDESIDLCISSPPYDTLRAYNGFSFDVAAIAKQLLRVLKPGGVVVWIIADETIQGSESGSSFSQCLTFRNAGFRIHDTMIYEKRGIRYPDTIRYYPCFEFMWVFSKGKPRTVNQIRDRQNQCAGQAFNYTNRSRDGSLRKTVKKPKGKTLGVRRNIWTYDAGGIHTAPDNLWKQHPAVMPLKLAEDHVVSWSNRGDVVVDICCGSGQVPIAALIRDRRFIGIDCSSDYVSLAQRRVTHFQRLLDQDTMDAIIQLDEHICNPLAAI